MKSKTIYSANKSALPAEEITRILEESNSILVASHVDPDGDSLGTQLAFAGFLRKNGKRVFLFREDVIPQKFQFLPELENIKHIHDVPENFSVDAAVILECPRITRAGNIIQKLNKNCKIINIDHHQDNEIYGDVHWVNSEASSVGEMVFEYFEAVGYNVDEPAATQLYVAMLTDTGRFRYSSTSERTMQIAGKLIGAGADPRTICDQIFYNMPIATIKIIGHALDKAEFLRDGRVCVLSIGKEILSKHEARLSETEGLAEYSLYGKGVEAGLLLKEGEDGVTRISLRSRGKFNVAELAAKFGGGGHVNAAGCSIEKSLGEAKKDILKELDKSFNG
jgi:phosphoesterase RecJ-like protein